MALQKIEWMLHHPTASVGSSGREVKVTISWNLPFLPFRGWNEKAASGCFFIVWETKEKDEMINGFKKSCYGKK
jgi:hypothetical protein